MSVIVWMCVEQGGRWYGRYGVVSDKCLKYLRHVTPGKWLKASSGRRQPPPLPGGAQVLVIRADYPRPAAAAAASKPGQCAHLPLPTAHLCVQAAGASTGRTDISIYLNWSQPPPPQPRKRWHPCCACPQLPVPEARLTDRAGRRADGWGNRAKRRDRREAMPAAAPPRELATALAG